MAYDFFTVFVYYEKYLVHQRFLGSYEMQMDWAVCPIHFA